jgi:hypothetical protein
MEEVHNAVSEYWEEFLMWKLQALDPVQPSTVVGPHQEARNGYDIGEDGMQWPEGVVEVIVP